MNDAIPYLAEVSLAFLGEIPGSVYIVLSMECVGVSPVFVAELSDP